MGMAKDDIIKVDSERDYSKEFDELISSYNPTYLHPEDIIYGTGAKLIEGNHYYNENGFYTFGEGKLVKICDNV